MAIKTYQFPQITDTKDVIAEDTHEWTAEWSLIPGGYNGSCSGTS